MVGVLKHLGETYRYFNSALRKFMNRFLLYFEDSVSKV
jgi:hypothetical protein